MQEGVEAGSMTSDVLGRREIMELFPGGLGIHHAGMLRKHRTLMERAFEKGYIKVRCRTMPCLP